MLSFSHTHAAVHVTAEKEYYDALCQKICLAAKKAKASMAEVSVGWDCVEADIGNNRREFSETVDRRVGVLKVSSRNTKDVKLITFDSFWSDILHTFFQEILNTGCLG